VKAASAAIQRQSAQSTRRAQKRLTHTESPAHRLSREGNLWPKGSYPRIHHPRQRVLFRKLNKQCTMLLFGCVRIKAEVTHRGVIEIPAPRNRFRELSSQSGSRCGEQQTIIVHPFLMRDGPSEMSLFVDNAGDPSNQSQ
jgi:hypothetical protein